MSKRTLLLVLGSTTILGCGTEQVSLKNRAGDFNCNAPHHYCATVTANPLGVSPDPINILKDQHNEWINWTLNGNPNLYRFSDSTGANPPPIVLKSGNPGTCMSDFDVQGGPNDTVMSVTWHNVNKHHSDCQYQINVIYTPNGGSPSVISIDPVIHNDG